MQIQSVTANAEFTNAQVVRALVQRAISKFEPKHRSSFIDWAGKFEIDFVNSKKIPGQLKCAVWVNTRDGLHLAGRAMLSSEANHDSN